MSSPAEAARAPRLAVVGSAMIEFFAARAGLRISDVDTLGFTASGSATILASVAARLGASVTLFGAVGADALGEEWKRRVSSLGVEVDGVAAVAGQLTPIAISTVDLDGSKSYAFYRFRGLCDPLDELSLSPAQEQSAADADVLVVTEAAVRGPGSRQVVERLIERRGAGRGPTILAVNYRASAWAGADEAASTLARIGSAVSVVCANGDELELLRGGGLETDLIFETLGAGGVRIHEGGRRRALAAAPPPGPVVLDTGAGDSFCGAVAVALGERRSPEAAARFASAVAALAITRPGLLEAAPRRDEVEAYLKDATDMETV